MEAGDRYWGLIEPYWESVDIYGSPGEFLRTFRAVPTPVGHLIAAHWCQSEVCNGGFHQFFLNPTGVLAPEAHTGFLSIGLPGLAELVSKALSFFPDPYPRAQESRLALLPKSAGRPRDIWDPFYALDESFYALKGSSPDRFIQAADSYAAAVAG